MELDKASLFKEYVPEGLIRICSFFANTSANSSIEGNTFQITLSYLATEYFPYPILSIFPEVTFLEKVFRKK